MRGRRKHNQLAPMPPVGARIVPETEVAGGATRATGRAIRLLNRRVLAFSCAAVALLAPLTYGLHYVQVRRTAGALLDRATELEGAGQWTASADYIFRYVQLVPDDAAARIRLAQSFDKSAPVGARRGRAIELYYTAVGVAEGQSRDACRERLAALLLESARFEESVEQAELLLKVDQRHSAAQRLRALALFNGYQSGTLSASRYDAATVWRRIEEAWRGQQGDVELAGVVAFIYREVPEMLSSLPTPNAAERALFANQVMDLLVTNAADNPRALLGRHLYRVRYQLPGADADLARAVELGPRDIGVRSVAAAYHLERGRAWLEQAQPGGTESPEAVAALDEAAAQYRFILDELDAADESAYLGLGEAYARRHDSARAIETWANGLRALHGASAVLNLRLAEAYVDSDQPDEAAEPLAAVRALADEASVAAAARRGSGLERLADLLQAQLDIRAGGVDRAQRTLERLAATGQMTAASPETARAQRVWFLLGEALGRSGLWDQAANAYESAAQLRPNQPTPRFGAAVAWYQARRLDLAIPHYQQLVSQVGSAELWLGLAQARFEQCLGALESQRDWQDVRDALARASELASMTGGAPFPSPWRIGLLEARLTAAGADAVPEVERRQRVNEQLAALMVQFGDDAKFLAEAAKRLVQWGEYDDAVPILARLHDLVGGDDRWAVVQAQLDASQGRLEAARELLEAHEPRVADAERRGELVRTVAGVCLLDNDLAGVRAALDELRRIEPWNLAVALHLAEVCLQQKDYAAAAKVQVELSRAGETGRDFSRYCEALILLGKSTGVGDDRFERARTLQQAIERDRPLWCGAYSLRGRIEEAQGLGTQAVESYRRAISFGEQRAWVYQRVVILLNRLQRFDEAEPILRRMQANGPIPSELEVPRLSGVRSKTELVDMAARALAANPRDPLARVWYGQLLLREAAATGGSSAAMTSAQEQLEQAAALAPREPAAWNGLFTCHLLAKRPEEARRVLHEMIRHCRLTEAQQAFVLAQGYELLGDRAGAIEKYEAAAKLAPESAAVWTRLAGLHRSSDAARSEQLLRRALEADPRSTPVRCALAELLAARGGNAAIESALALLSSPDRLDGVASQQLRTRASLLLRRQGGVLAAREEARRLLEALARRNADATAVDFAMAGQLCEWQLDFEAAERHYASAASLSGDEARWVVAAAEFQLRRGKRAEAERWLQRLDSTAPLDAAAIAVRVRCLASANRGDEAAALLETWAKDQESPLAHDQIPDLCLAVGRIYQTAGLHDRAEKWLRRLRDLDARRYGPLALGLALQGGDKADEAVRICRDAARMDDSANPLITLASVHVASGRPVRGNADLSEVFTQALARFPNHAELLTALANLDAVSGDSSSALVKYEQLRRLRPADPVVLNNLAALLAEIPGREDEAFACLQQARDLGGETAATLDTEGMVRLSQRDSRRAFECFAKAAAADPLDARYRVHLAAAYQAAGMADRAQEIFRGVDPSLLGSVFFTPKERELVAALRQGSGIGGQ